MIFFMFGNGASMTVIESILLGVLQGLTEFLPVSSSGHLVLLQELLKINEQGVVFEVALHLGTLLSVLTFYHRTIRLILKDVCSSRRVREGSSPVNLLVLLIVGSIPTALIGFSLKDLFERLFDQPVAVGVFLMVTGGFLFLTRGKMSQTKMRDVNNLDHLSTLDWKKAVVIGIAQGMAITPGISRAGATIATGILLKVDRSVAALYSFLLSIPAILGASLLQLKDVTHFSSHTYLLLAIGVITSYIAGCAGLWGVLHFVKRGRLEVFSYYLWALGLVSIVFFWQG